MSEPKPEPAPAPRNTLPRRAFVAVVYVAIGFVLVWQGFGLAGYGTDVHTKRVSWVLFQLLGFGALVAGLRAWLAVRVLVAIAGLGSASLAWWDIRSSNFKSAISLRDAVAERDRLSRELETATLDDIDRHQGFREIETLSNQYPSLTAGLTVEHDRWKYKLANDFDTRLDRASRDDPKAVAGLRRWLKTLAKLDPGGTELRDTRLQLWLKEALAVRRGELDGATGDPVAFDRTAPGRKTLAAAFPDTRAELVKAEEEWAERTAVRLVRDGEAHDAKKDPRFPVKWRACYSDLLSVDSLDKDDGRFRWARRTLFAAAHAAAQRSVTAHLEAGRYDDAFGLARKHAVDWNATAAILGEDEVKKLDALRDYCEAFAKLYEVSAKPPPVAPPPRVKPE